MLPYIVNLAETVFLQTPGTSLCHGDVGAVFICKAMGTVLTWRIDDDNGGDHSDYYLIHYNDDPVGGLSVKRNGYYATLVEVVDTGLSSVLTILTSTQKNLTIECSDDNTSEMVQFYHERPGIVGMDVMVFLISQTTTFPFVC